MAHPMGESKGEVLRLDFDRRLLSDGCGAKTITTAAQFEHDRHGFEGYLGNVGFQEIFNSLSQQRKFTLPLVSDNRSTIRISGIGVVPAAGPVARACEIKPQM